MQNQIVNLIEWEGITNVGDLTVKSDSTGKLNRHKILFNNSLWFIKSTFHRRPVKGLRGEDYKIV